MNTLRAAFLRLPFVARIGRYIAEADAYWAGLYATGPYDDEETV